jgi:ABC-type nitrate/sulfonate/bicarbonate transport system substrate-binding protein
MPRIRPLILVAAVLFGALLPPIPTEVPERSSEIGTITPQNRGAAGVILSLWDWGAGGAVAHAAPGPQRSPLNVGHVSITAISWPFWAAERIGSFDQEGLAVDVQVLGSAPALTTAVVSNSVDIGRASMDVHVRAVERGAEITWFMSEFGTPIYALLARPEIGSYADLRGRTVVVDSPNGITTWLLRRMLGAQGIGPDEYSLVYVGSTPDRLAAQLAGGVQASMLLQPFDFAGERQGQRRLGNSNELVRNYEFAGYNARRDWLARNEDTVARYLRAYLAGQRWLYDPANKEQAIQTLSDRTRLGADDARATYEMYVERERSFPAGMRINLAGVQGVLDSLVEQGELTTPTPPPSKYVDSSYVDRISP